MGSQNVSVLGAPAGVHNPEIWLFDPDGQFKEPCRPGLVGSAIRSNLCEEGFVLAPVFLAGGAVAWPQVSPLRLRILCGPRHGVEFVVAHHSASRPSIEHGAHKFERSQLARAPIDEVSNKYGDTARMPPSTSSMNIAELTQQGLEPIGVPMNVADNVISHAVYPLAGVASETPANP
jgi:hypothetical protein